MRREHPEQLRTFLDAADADPELRWYAIADSAQAFDLPRAVLQPGRSVRCLFDAEQGTPLAGKAPHLVELPSPSAGEPAWQWILREAPHAPCLTVIATRLGFDALFAQCQAASQVVLPDDYEMFFAFWDPAILGTLVGQPDDTTLYVPGPVLGPAQIAALTCELAGWWYWDRDGGLHALATMPERVEPAPLPFVLTQEQVDALVEASMPDHLLYYVDLNQRHLLDRIQGEAPYRFMCRAYDEARMHEITGLRDQVNFVCAKLIYGARFDTDPAIAALLARVRAGRLTFTDAIAEIA